MRARVLMHSRAGDRLSGAGSIGPDAIGRRSRTSSRSSVIEHVGHEEARRRSGLQGPVLLGSANKITRPHTRAGGASADLVEVLDASGEPRFVEQAPLRPPRAGDVRPGSSQSAMAFLDSPNVASNFNHAHTQRWSTLGSPGGPSSGMFARRGSETSARFSRRGSDASSVATPEPSPRYASGARGLHTHSPIGHIEELRAPALVTASVDDLRSGVLSPSPLAPHGAESLVRSGSARRSRLSSADGLANRPERRSFVNTGSKRWSGLFGGNGSQRKITASNISRPTSVSSSALSDAAADMLARPFEDSSPRSANFNVPARIANRSSTATSRASSTRGTDNTEDEPREMMPSDELRAIVNRNRSGSSASTHSSAMSPPPWAMPISPGVAARHSVASRRPSTSDAIGTAYPMASAYYAPAYTPPIHSSLSSVSADRSWAARPASANEAAAPNPSSLGRRPSGFDAAAFDATAAFESIPSPHPVRGEDDAAPQDVDDDEDSVLDEDAGTGSSPARSLRDERPHTPPQQILHSRGPLTPFQGGRPLPTDAPRSPGAGFDDPEVELLEDDCDAAAPPADGSDDLDGARIGLTTMPLGRSSVLVRSRSNEALRGVADAVSRAAGQNFAHFSRPGSATSSVHSIDSLGRCDRRSYAYV
jgi:ornithine carrier protein